MRNGFEVPRAVASLMTGYRGCWCIAGGWAIDLYLDRVTRDHEDIEIAVLRNEQLQIQSHLAGWRLTKCVAGDRAPWLPEEVLALPVHEVHAVRGNDSLEILLNEAGGGLWRFRRDLRVSRPLAKAMCETAAGIPCLAPEIVLLYKAKNTKQKDSADFALAVKKLDAEGRDWLRYALRTTHPGHPWQDALRAVGPEPAPEGE